VVRAENTRLAAENARLRELLDGSQGRAEALHRAAKRQAAPFSKGAPSETPRRPGRKPGAEYGRHANRPVPAQVDEQIDVGLPDCCPDCAGELVLERVAAQYQEDLPPVRRHVCRFDVAVGRCQRCRRRVQGRHPRQTSDALGAAACQVGPRALALAAHLNKELGLPLTKVARVLAQLGGLRVTASGLYQALHRLANLCEATYQALIEGVRNSPAVAADETGWRVSGHKAWLWDFVGDGVTVYLIAAGRGYQQAAEVLGETYAGTLERDGWAPYRRFEHASHQSCVAHLLRRCAGMIEDAQAGQARVPHAVRRILKDALALRALRDADPDVIDADEFGLRVTELETRTDKLLAGNICHPPNRRLIAHLSNERAHLFTFLTTAGVQATNWRAEQALRPACANRKHWGGNNSWHGARTQQILMSVLRTARQQDSDPVALLIALQHARTPSIAPQLRLPAAAADNPAADTPAVDNPASVPRSPPPA
jgi:transposase